MKRPNLSAFIPSSWQKSRSTYSSRQKRRHQIQEHWLFARNRLPFQYHRQPNSPLSTRTSLSTLRPSVMFFHNAKTTAEAAGASSNTSKLSTTSILLDSFKSVLASPGGIATSVVGFVALLVYWRYQGAIRQRLKRVKEESWLFGAGVTMVRGDVEDESHHLFPNLQFLQVNPEFEEAHPDWNFVALGDYLASLRPKQLPKNVSSQDLPKLIQQELEAGLALALLKALGPNLGGALLPAVGFGPVQGQAQKLGSQLATRWVLTQQKDTEDDKAGLPISILSLLALTESNAKVNGGTTKSRSNPLKSTANIDDSEDPSMTSVLNDKSPGTYLSAIQKMKRGENVNGPTFDETMVPHSGFVLTKHFHWTIQRMEGIMVKKGHCGDHSSVELQTARADLEEEEEEEPGDASPEPAKPTEWQPYNPNDRSMGSLVPINPRLFPDLYLGYGDAPCSHTKRQVLQMRLLAVLLNRLGANYHRVANNNGDESLFTMQLDADGPVISKPTELIQGLIDIGQDISVGATSRMTSFGLGMCIKEVDGSWSNVPLGVFLESGYEDESGTMAPVMMPHSGLRLIIGDGPLTDKQAEEYDDFDESAVSNPLIIQHFIGIEGFCGWKSDQNPEVPFIENVESGRPLKAASEIVRAVRLAGLYATVLNGLATDLELPFGGYGVTAVCNDSTAIVQQCLYKESYIFPLTTVGRYMQRTLRYGQNLDRQLRDASSDTVSLQDELKDLEALMEAMVVLPSDVNATPANAADAARRLLHTMQSQRPLALMNESKNVMENIIAEHRRIKVREVPGPSSLKNEGEQRLR